jgi:hypothetical protein
MTRCIDGVPRLLPSKILKMEVPMKSAPRMDVVKREAKEGKLKDFISAHLATVTANEPTTWLLIARSSHSPVVKALNALAGDIAKAQVTVRAILAVLDNGAVDTQTETMMLCPTECRVAGNPCLLEAHEQLVLSATTCWIGDSMRREPDKRDAYECYAADHATTAHWSTTSFNRLWAASDAIVPRGLAVAVAAESVSADDVVATQVPAAPTDLPNANDLPPAADVSPSVTASTRH